MYGVDAEPQSCWEEARSKKFAFRFWVIASHPSAIVFGRCLKHNHDFWAFGIWLRIAFLEKIHANPHISKCWIFNGRSLFDVFSRAWNTYEEAFMCTMMRPRPLKSEVSGPHFKRDTRPKLHRVKWTRRMCFNVYIAVTTVPLTVSTAYSRARRSHSYQA